MHRNLGKEPARRPALRVLHDRLLSSTLVDVAFFPTPATRGGRARYHFLLTEGESKWQRNVKVPSRWEAIRSRWSARKSNPVKRRPTSRPCVRALPLLSSTSSQER